MNVKYLLQSLLGKKENMKNKSQDWKENGWNDVDMISLYSLNKTYSGYKDIFNIYVLAADLKMNIYVYSKPKIFLKYSFNIIIHTFTNGRIYFWFL